MKNHLKIKQPQLNLRKVMNKKNVSDQWLADQLGISPEEQMIVIRLRKPKKNEKFQYMSSEMINQFLNYGRHNHHFSHRKIGDIMTNLEFECIHKRTGNYFKVVEIPLDQQQIYIASEDFDFEFEEADDDEAAAYQQLGLPL